MGISSGALGAGLQGGVQGFMRAFQMLSDMKRQKEMDAQRTSERESERDYRRDRDTMDDTRFVLDAREKGYTPYEAPVNSEGFQPLGNSATADRGGAPDAFNGIKSDVAALRGLGSDELINTPRGTFRYQKPEDPVVARERSRSEQANAAMQKLTELVSKARTGDEGSRNALLAQDPKYGELWAAPKPTAPVMGDDRWKAAQSFLSTLRGQNVSQPRERNIDPLSDEGIARGAKRAEALLQAGGGAGSGRISDGERKNSAFLQQATQANAILEGFSKPGIKDAAVSSIPGVGRFLASDSYQQLEQASLQLADAWLRATSGAAISEQEVRRNAKMFMPQASDKPEVIEQKRQARQTVLESLRKMGGRAVDQQSAPRILKPGEKPPGDFE